MIDKILMHVYVHVVKLNAQNAPFIFGSRMTESTATGGNLESYMLSIKFDQTERFMLICLTGEYGSLARYQACLWSIRNLRY